MRLTGAVVARDPLPHAQAPGAAVVGHEFTLDPLDQIPLSNYV